MKVFQDLPDIESPVPNVANPTETMIGLIPLFDDPYFNNFPAYLKAALYSRQTWLLYTDAHDQNVAIKLYIEDTLKDVATPILEANGLTETDALWFNAPPLPDTLLGVWGRLGKKLNIFWDPQLSEYEKIVYWDADMFKHNDPKSRDIFARTAGHPYLSFLLTFTKPRRDWRPRMIHRSARNVLRGGIPIQEVFDRAGLGRVLQEIKGHLTRPAGGLGIYPAKLFHAEHTDFITWLQAHGPYIGDDEFSVALGAVKFKIYLSSIRASLGLTHASINAYFDGDTEHAFVHGRPIPSNEADCRQLLTTLANPTSG